MAKIELHLLREKYTPVTVLRFIKRCLDAGGVPMFRTRYAGEPFEVDGKRAVVAICYGARGKAGVIGRFPYSRIFFDVPEDIYILMETTHGEWKYLVEKYEKDYGEIVKKLMKAKTVFDWPIESEEALEKLLKSIAEEEKIEEKKEATS